VLHLPRTVLTAARAAELYAGTRSQQEKRVLESRGRSPVLESCAAAVASGFRCGMEILPSPSAEAQAAEE
jgi:hypothetical protein